jgi:predicted component of type VI protein secretion system
MVDKDVAMLIIRGGAHTHRQWVLQDAVCLIGRGDDCHVMIDDRQASRHHARITRQDQGYTLEDLDSKNGTFLNGLPLTAATLLKDGDEIGIAFAARLSFVGAGATAPLLFDVERPETLLKLDSGSKRVWVVGKELDPPLSLAQYRLLELLYQHPGQVVSREEIVHAVWPADESEGVSEQAIDALARRLRERIAEADAGHQYLITVRGHGYRLQPAAE